MLKQLFGQYLIGPKAPPEAIFRSDRAAKAGSRPVWLDLGGQNETLSNMGAVALHNHVHVNKFTT